MPCRAMRHSDSARLETHPAAGVHCTALHCLSGHLMPVRSSRSMRYAHRRGLFKRFDLLHFILRASHATPLARVVLFSRTGFISGKGSPLTTCPAT